jgi:hypothetical protein
VRLIESETEDVVSAGAKRAAKPFARLFSHLVRFASVSEIALLLLMCGHEGVSTVLRVLRRLFIVDEVMPENVERFFRGPC